jgi:hypothetical protein
MHHSHPTFHLRFVSVPVFRLGGHFNTNVSDPRMPLDRSKQADSVHFAFAVYSVAILQKFVNLQFVSCDENSYARVVSSLILQYFASFEDVALHSLRLELRVDSRTHLRIPSAIALHRLTENKAP